MNLFVFDIETIPDTDAGRKLYRLGDLSDSDVAKAMFQKRRQETGDTFLRAHLHRIVAISMVMRSAERCRVWSLGDTDSSEHELIRQFFGGIAKYTPTLVSWNGNGFDLPVLHYRSLVHNISAPRYWETGEQDREFRFDNYLNRYHWRHIDLMDVLSGFQPRAAAPLDEIATMLGFPGKMGMHGGKVWDAYQAGDIAEIRNYCETDVLNTFLVYLRFEIMRGALHDADYRNECALLRETLRAAQKPHLEEFLEAWQSGDS